MVTPEAPVKLHRIQNDQLYHYYLGDPIEVLLLHEGGTSELVVVGPNIAGGELVQLFIPGEHVSHRARHRQEALVPRRQHANGPASIPRQDVEMGNIEALAVKYPEAAADLRTFPLPAKPKG